MFVCQGTGGYGDVYVCVRALVGMVMYNNETKEIAKPSELLSSIKAIMNVLQSIENYGVSFSLCYTRCLNLFNSVSPCPLHYIFCVTYNILTELDIL